MRLAGIGGQDSWAAGIGHDRDAACGRRRLSGQD
jgi:hypothetical protein